MSDNLNNPREYDAVLGGQNVQDANAVVLGGIEGVKRRLSSQVTEHQISALSEALNYNEEGLALVIQALNNSEEQVHFAAYKLLKDREELEVKAALDKYVQQYYFIRFNGLYYSHTKSYNWYLLRFYQDGILAENVFTLEQDVIEKAARWFHQDNNQVTYRGIYKIEGNSLKFSTINRHHIIDFWGEIEIHGYTISLNFYGRTNHYKKFSQYSFINLPNIR